MKNRLIVVASLFALSCSLAWVADSQSGPKVKVKGGKLIERDKSKPVRRAIEAWYDLNIEDSSIFIDDQPYQPAPQ